jgi:hypothetical protein
MREMRKNARVADRCTVVVKVLAVDGKPRRDVPPCYCHAADLSADGVRLVLGAELPLGSQIELVVVVQEPPATFRHVGVVRWSKTAEDAQTKSVGVEFTGSPPAVMLAWAQMLAKRHPTGGAKRARQFAQDDKSFW